MLRMLMVATATLIIAGCAPRSPGVVRDASVVIAPHAEPICMIHAPLPSRIKYKVLGAVDTSKQWYGSQSALLPVMAAKARRFGADAVISVVTGHKVGAFAWARPTGTGIAVKFDTPTDLNCEGLGGEFR